MDERYLESRMSRAIADLADLPKDPRVVMRELWGDVYVAIDPYVSMLVRQRLLLQQLAQSPDEREDCKQAIYEWLPRGMEEFMARRTREPSALFVPWLKLAIRHRIIDYRRRHWGYRRGHERPWRQFVELLDDTLVQSDAAILPKVTIMRKILTNHVRHLPDDEREALWRWMHGEIKQTAAARRALRKLRYYYKEGKT